MIEGKRIVCVIPARLKSTRLPKKMLSMLGGKPLLQWVWEKASSISIFDEVAFAVDSKEVANCVSQIPAPYWMTSEKCPSGTDRLVEIHQAKKMTGDIWVNWQGDEPFITEGMIYELLQSCKEQDVDIWTLRKKILDLNEIANPHIAKVVCNEKGNALYFSRSPIPYYRDPTPDLNKTVYKHVGLYAFTSNALDKISSLNCCDLEIAEQLEQLRFLYHGLTIRAHVTEQEVFGIDLPEHLVKAEHYIKNLFGPSSA